MSFRMKCPKCETRNYSITRDIRTSTAKDPVSGLIYSCRCGRQMFGQQVVDEHERQLREFEAVAGVSSSGASGGSAPPEQERDKLRQAYEYRREYVAKKRAEEQEQAAARKEEEDRRWRERVAGVDESGAAAPSGDFESCAWRDCGKASRPRSKYCSRECSNKNARHRHKLRKRPGGKDTAAA